MDGFEKYGNMLPPISTSPKPLIDAVKKGQEEFGKFKEDVVKDIQDSEVYKALDSIGRPVEDKGGIDGKPMRAQPHNVGGIMELCTSNAIVQCPCGMTFCKMDATPMPRIHGVGQKMNNAFLTINDHLPFINVFPYNLFTLCTNQLNPFVALATLAATVAKGGVYTPTPWPCVASLPLFTFVPWIPTQFKVLRNGMPVVTNLSKLPCYLPALIEIKHCGQGLDDSWLKSMFVGQGGIDGLLNVLSIISKASGKGVKLTDKATKPGMKALNTMARTINTGSQFSESTLQFMQGDWGNALGSFGGGMEGVGGILEKVGMSRGANFFNNAKTATDYANVGLATAEGDVKGMVKNTLSVSGVENADMINTYIDLADDSKNTLEYMVETGQANDRELANQKVMLAANATLPPESVSQLQDTLEQNDRMQADMEKKLPKQEAPEVEEPSKPYKTVPLEKTKKTESAPSTPQPAQTEKKGGNPFADAMNFDLPESDGLQSD
ncbi:MAG: DUF4280 domain-containing protein [Prevotella sp.]|nr:DUF4280 domain-containing protein [Prevotella sp.]